jgi:hypothetical protein
LTCQKFIAGTKASHQTTRSDKKPSTDGSGGCSLRVGDVDLLQKPFTRRREATKNHPLMAAVAALLGWVMLICCKNLSLDDAERQKTIH